MSELYHYGVKGMKWGVRKDRPSYSEKRNVRKLKGEYKSALKNAVVRTKMADADREAVRKADRYYEKLQKKGFGITKKTQEKRMTDLQNVETELKKRMKALEIGESNQERAYDILDERAKNLGKYVKELTDRYGKENVKQLELRKRDIKAGKDYVIQNVYKTGLRVQDLPIVGKRVVGKQVSQWEREKRTEAHEENIERRKKGIY